MSTLKLRTARLSDAQTLARVHYASLQTLCDLLPSSYLGAKSEQGLVELWSHELKASIRKTFVAETADYEICGFVSFCPAEDPDLSDRPAGEILRVYVAPDYLGKGTGAILLEHGVSVLQNRGYEPIIVWVFEANTRARRFYMNQGFKPDGITKYDAGLSIIRYMLEK